MRSKASPSLVFGAPDPYDFGPLLNFVGVAMDPRLWPWAMWTRASAASLFPCFLLVVSVVVVLRTRALHCVARWLHCSCLMFFLLA